MGMFGNNRPPSAANALYGMAAAPTPPAVRGYSGRWQDRYAAPDWQQRLTRLNPQQEQQFQTWAARNRVPITDDYDMRGYWVHGAQGAQVNPNDRRLHFPDTYKTPLHRSFSGESIYADPSTQPPHWNERDQLVAPDGTILFDERAPRR